MKSYSKCFLAIGVIAVLTSVLVFPAGANHTGGLTQTVSAALNLPAIPNASPEVCTGVDEQGNPTNCKSADISQDARTIALELTYNLVNASHLPSVEAVAGSAAVPCPGLNGTTEKKPGIALIASGADFKSGSAGSLMVNGEKVQEVTPSQNATTFYDTQAIFVRFCQL